MSTSRTLYPSWGFPDLGVIPSHLIERLVGGMGYQTCFGLGPDKTDFEIKMRTIINFALMIIVVTAFVAVVCASAYLLGWIYKRGRKVSHQPQKDDVRNRREKNLDSTILTMEIDMPPSYEESKQQTKEKVAK